MNGHAEQRNGLIKHHLLPTVQATGNNQLGREINRVLRYYNEGRKQEALGWLSPVGFEKKISTMSIKPKRDLYNFNLDDDGFKKA